MRFLGFLEVVSLDSKGKKKIDILLHLRTFVPSNAQNAFPGVKISYAGSLRMDERETCSACLQELARSLQML